MATAFETFINDELPNRVASQEATQSTGYFPRYTGTAKLTTERSPAQLLADIGAAAGPASATDNAVARFDTTTGKLLQNSAVTVDDSGNISTSGTVDGRDVSADGATLDALDAGAIMSGDAAGGELSGTYPNPTVNDGADATAIHDNIAGEIAAVTEKVSPADADLLLIEDSAAANAKKRVQAGNLPFLQNVVEDTSPQLGGTLDVNDNPITNGGTINIKGGGNIWLDAYDTLTTGVVLIHNTDPGGQKANLNIDDGDLIVGGNIAPTGTVDGRDVAADGTKLDGIEANANNYAHPNHSGDVTSVADGATTIASGAVSYAKMQDVSAASKLLGRGSAAGAGDPEEITLGTNLSMSGTTLNASGGGASLPVDDTTSIVQDPVDNTKQMRIDVGNVSTGTVRELIMPDTDVVLRKDNLGASTDPTITDDVNAGYVVGSLWGNTSTDVMWVCIDNGGGGAVWLPVNVWTECLHIPITPTGSDVYQIVGVLPQRAVITKVLGNTDQSTYTFNIEARTHGSEFAAGSDVLTSDLIADFDGQSTTTFNGNGVVLSNKSLWVVSSAVGTPTQVTISIQGIWRSQ